jgi:hypothetical protein
VISFLFLSFFPLLLCHFVFLLCRPQKKRKIACFSHTSVLFLPSLPALSVRALRPSHFGEAPRFFHLASRAPSFFFRGALIEHSRKMTLEKTTCENPPAGCLVASRHYRSAISFPFVCVRRSKEQKLVQVGRDPRASFWQILPDRSPTCRRPRAHRARKKRINGHFFVLF